MAAATDAVPPFFLADAEVLGAAAQVIRLRVGGIYRKEKFAPPVRVGRSAKLSVPEAAAKDKDLAINRGAR